MPRARPIFLSCRASVGTWAKIAKSWEGFGALFVVLLAMVRARAWLIAVGGCDEAVPAPRGQAPACYLVGGHNVRYAFAVLPPLVSSHAVHLVFNLLVVYQSNTQLSSACLRSARSALYWDLLRKS